MSDNRTPRQDREAPGPADPRPGRRFTLDEPPPPPGGDTPRPRQDFAAELPTRPIEEPIDDPTEQTLA
ncbi:hypothetical protein, partial [Halomonas sp. BC04]|uniref:hypothetical protein n=1 Tax=Halomonas sp. BC04 TaxID=1403540 RepID=UPI0005BADA50